MPYSYLKASPDLCVFQFAGLGATNVVSRIIRFTPHSAPNIINIQLSDIHQGETQTPEIVDQIDFYHIQRTIMQAIELFTEKYPEKTIRLGSNNRHCAWIFRTALNNHLNRLMTMFEIQPEKPFFLSFRSIAEPFAFLLKRKPDWRFAVHTVTTTLISRSALFEQIVQVEIGRKVDIGLVSFEPEKSAEPA